MAVTPVTGVGAGGSGGGGGTGLPTVTAADIISLMRCTDAESKQFVVHVAATGAFKLDYMFTNDGGTSWYVGKTVTSSTVVVDGGTASYVASAEMVVDVGYDFKIQIFNTTGGNIDYASEYRYYSNGR